MVGAVDEKLDEAVVFQDRHAGFPLASVDQDLALQVMTSATVGRRERAPETARRGMPGNGLRSCSNAPTRGRARNSRARKAARQLDWRPSTPLDDGLRETLEWFATRKAAIA